MSANMYAAQPDMNPASTVSCSYAHVKNLDIAGGLEIRLPHKTTLDARVYKCDKTKIAGGVFIAGESDDVADVLKNPAVLASVRREGVSSSKMFFCYARVPIKKQKVTAQTTDTVLI